MNLKYRRTLIARRAAWFCLALCGVGLAMAGDIRVATISNKVLFIDEQCAFTAFACMNGYRPAPDRYVRHLVSALKNNGVGQPTDDAQNVRYLSVTIADVDMGDRLCVMQWKFYRPSEQTKAQLIRRQYEWPSIDLPQESQQANRLLEDHIARYCLSQVAVEVGKALK